MSLQVKCPQLERRFLGKTGLQVSPIAVGTAALGMDYGIQVPREFGRPCQRDAIYLLKRASALGVNLFDTSPSYGSSERLLGLALGKEMNCYFATKVPIPRNSQGELVSGPSLFQVIQASLERSLKALGRDVLDIVQIHNVTSEVITRGEVTEALLRAREGGKIHCLGASVYGEEAALAAIEAKCFDVLQVAYNLLDQRMARRVFPAVREAGMGLLLRSVFLKGALTRKGRYLPEELKDLAVAAERARGLCNDSWESLPHTALRFSLSAPQASSVLVGVRTVRELDEAVRASGQGPLPEALMARARRLATSEEHLLNPSYWSVA